MTQDLTQKTLGDLVASLNDALAFNTTISWEIAQLRKQIEQLQEQLETERELADNLGNCIEVWLINKQPRFRKSLEDAIDAWQEARRVQ